MPDSTSTRSGGRPARALFAVIGAAMLCVAIFQLWQTIDLLGRAERVTATVVGFEPTPRATNDPVLRFTTADGQVVEFHRGWGTSKTTRYSLGEMVEAIYDPADPQAARVGRFGSLWWTPTVMLLLGTAFLWVASGRALPGQTLNPRIRRTPPPLDRG